MNGTCYLLTTETDYVGETPRGIFSSFKLALTEAEKIHDEDTVNIYEVDVDQEYEYYMEYIWSKRPSTGKIIINTFGETK